MGKGGEKNETDWKEGREKGNTWKGLCLKSLPELQVLQKAEVHFK